MAGGLRNGVPGPDRADAGNCMPMARNRDGLPSEIKGNPRRAAPMIHSVTGGPAGAARDRGLGGLALPKGSR